MKFISLPHYFYKLQNLLYLVILLPVLLFPYLFLEMQKGRITPMMEEDQWTLIIVVFIVIGVSDWLAGFYLFRKLVKNIQETPSLGERLEKYADITLLRFGILSIDGLLYVVGLWFTYSQVFVALFVVNIIFLSMAWPLPGKVVRDLHLRGDEKQMVYRKKDIA